MVKRPPVMQTLQHGLIVLRHVAESDHPVAFRTLEKLTGFNRSTLSRLLTALAEQGFVRKTSDRRFTLDYGAYLVGSTFLLKEPLIRFGRSYIDELSRSARTPAYLGTIWREKTVVLYHSWTHLQPDGQIYFRIGLDLHRSSIGRIMTAFWDEEKQQAFAETLGDEGPDWLEDMAHVREQGYATREDLENATVHSLAVPVHDATNSVVAAVAVNVDAHRTEELLPHLLATAERLSALLGYIKPRLDRRIAGRAAGPSL